MWIKHTGRIKHKTTRSAVNIIPTRVPASKLDDHLPTVGNLITCISNYNCNIINNQSKPPTK